MSNIMVSLECICYVAMLNVLWRSYRGWFFVIQTTIFLEWPVQIYLNHYYFHLAYKFWFRADQLDILLTFWCAYLIWEILPLAAYLMVMQSLITMTHYALIDRVQEYWKIPQFFYAMHILGILIELAVIWGIIVGKKGGRSCLETREPNSLPLPHESTER